MFRAFTLKLAIAALTTSAGTCSGFAAPVSDAQKIMGAHAAVAQVFNDMTRQPGVETALVLATAPSAKFHAFKTQMKGIAPSTVADMPMRTASLGKMFTAVVILQLLEEQRLRLDQRLGELLHDADMPPGYTVAGLHALGGVARGGSITVRQLLNHTSGLADMFFDRASAAELPVSFAERYVLNTVGVLPDALHLRQWQGGRDLLGYYFAQRYPQIVLALPGEQYHYSDVNYFLLGLIAERVTGQPLAQLYRERIFDPLRLSSAEFEWHEPRRALPMPHYLNMQAFLEASFGPLPQPLPPTLANAEAVSLGLNTSFDWGGGGLMLSARDLDTFLRALLGGGLFKHRSTLVLMQNGVAMGDGRHYGLGLIRRDVGSLACYGHDGAWGIEAWHCPQRDLTLVLATNQLVSPTDTPVSQLLSKLLRIYK